MKNNSFRFSTQDRILFAKRLSILLKAGVPILEALYMLKDQTSGKNKVIIEKLTTDVSGGQLLSASLFKYQNLFSEFSLNIIRIGESTGQLHESLHYLSEDLKKRQQLQKKIIAALVYPSFVVVATVVITLLLTLYVFPKILPVFKSFHFNLPLTTRVLMAFTNIVLKYYAYFIGAFFVFPVIFLYALRRPSFRRFFERALLRLPLIGNMFRSFYVANLCRNLGLLLQSGVQIVESLTVTAKTASSSLYRTELNRLAKHAARGEKISHSMPGDNFLFPQIVGQMVSVGESSGNLSGSFLYLADNFEDEVDELTKNLSSLIEPLLMIGMGLAVGFVAVAIITPIYQITQNLHP